MVKKLALAFLVVVVALGAALYFWAQAVLGSDLVRGAIARQIEAAIGQPVRIGAIRASLFPRLTVVLGDVGIGAPERIAFQRLDLGTDLGALFSRRIEHGTVDLVGGRMEMPVALPVPTPTGDQTGDSALEIVSIDRISLSDVSIVSGGRTLTANAEVTPTGRGLEIGRLALEADSTRLTVTGRLDDLAAPSGALTVEADRLDALALLAFVNEFAAGATAADAAAPATAPATTSTPTTSAMRLDVTLNAEQATFGALTLASLQGTAHIDPREARVDPVRFDVFGGSYEGRLTASLAATPDIAMNARVSQIDMADIMRFASMPADTFTGRLSGQLDVTSRGVTADAVLAAAEGTGRIEVVDGAIPSLALVGTVVEATSGRAGTSPLTASAGEGTFTKLGASVDIERGVARTTDLRLDATDVTMTGTGRFALDGSDVALDATIQLSEALSQRAGRDLVRYAGEQGRVTLPANVSGRLGALRVTVDAADAARRAIRNRAQEEVGDRIRRGLGGLLGR